MSRFIYTKEMLKFIAAQFKKHEVREVTAAFNKKFGTNKTPGQIKSTITNHGIVCGRAPGEANKGKLRTFTNEQVAFIRSEYQNLTVPELTKQFNSKFSADKSKQQIKNFIFQQGIRCNRSGHFEKGQQPWNTGKKGWTAGGRSAETRFKPGHQRSDTQQVGAIRADRKDGYLMVKVEMPNKWRLMHVVEWEKHYGPIPPNHRLWFKDNDRTNWHIDNLMLITRAQGAVINKQGLGKVASEHKAAVVVIADIKMKISKLVKAGAAA
ncbi:HNH endonuclease signature motif containing protein [Arsukibacterium indicum]|uniref:HNH endonuclease n=1 Tax=Arsukibacterium indicum TaxID=2848612 RepID=A0ABS6MIP3_9GAMM|nr:HNH endonuclease signature motif containing protein [Arsukibacterium indicum]MBV2128201.1 HNH endonuclease [Arsukibacterium indicum]